jgi:hypothetical protein
MRKDDKNTNNRIDKTIRRRKNLRCDFCRPNRGENAKRRPKYGKTKPKHKTQKRDNLIEVVLQIVPAVDTNELVGRSLLLL